MRADAGDKAVGDPPLLGDLNGDGQVGILDAGLLQAKLGLSPVTPPGGDLNVDQLVNRGDIVVLLGTYGQSNAEPSAPAAMLVDVALAEDTALADDVTPLRTTSRSTRMLATRHRLRAVDVALEDYRVELRPVVRHDRLWLGAHRSHRQPLAVVDENCRLTSGATFHNSNQIGTNER